VDVVAPNGFQICQTCLDGLGESRYVLGWEDDPLQPVNLRSLMSGEPIGAEWLIEPLLPAGKLVAIISKRGEGKSLMMLDLVANVATGQSVLHQPAGEPKSVLYLDMEMGPDDLYDRLNNLGYGLGHPLFDTLCQNLHYYQLPSLPALNTEEGGEKLEELVERHGAVLVVIDTVSRVIDGAENDAEPYRDLFRHTETRLKRRRVTLARLDHLGKDHSRGSRGSSAKEDPMDVVWQLTMAAAGALSFTLTKGRQGWIPQSVTVHRQDTPNGEIRHVILKEPAPEWLAPLMEEIRKLNLPSDTSAYKVMHALKAIDKGARYERIQQAWRDLKILSQKVGKPTPSLFGNGNGKDRESLGNTGKVPGNVPEPLFPGISPTNSGRVPRSQPDLDDFPLDDDYEPTPDELAEMEEEG
jgi:KaiC/GvpD/RAD55 family RecA-like ATPase